MNVIDPKILKKDSDNSSLHQPVLGEKGLIVYLTFLSAFIPLSTDIYLPALPHLVDQLNTSVVKINLTLIAFFFCLSLSSLIWGPLSDQYGRCKTLQKGLFLYVLGSLGCSLAPNIEMLILFRCLQGLGGGSAPSIAMAIIKDSFHAKRQESIIAMSISAAMIAPIVAPIMGAFLLQAMSWRAMFYMLTFLGCVGLLVSFVFKETLQHCRKGGVTQAMQGLLVSAKNRDFFYLLINFSLLGIPMMAFITGSSYVYIDEFGLGEQTYSYFFALNAAFIILGPLAYLMITNFVNKNIMVSLSFMVSFLCGILICLFGHYSPFAFAFALLPATFAGSLIRPFSTTLMLDKQKDHIGASSSLIAFAFQTFGCLGMLAMSLNVVKRTTAIGFLYLLVSLIGFTLWLFYSGKKTVHSNH